MKKDKILSDDLKSLLAKFSSNDVLSTIEKEYASVTSHNVDLDLIDDNHFLKGIKIPKREILLSMEEISHQGYLNIVVIRQQKNRYEIVLGRTKYFASKNLGLKQISSVIKPIEDQEMLLLLLAYMRENRDLNAIGLATVSKMLSKNYGFTQAAIGQLCHLSRPAITNLMRLLKLEPIVQEAITDGVIGYGHAKALLSLPKEQVIQIVEQIKTQNLSVRQVEQMVRIQNQKSPLKQEELNEKANTGITIKGNELRLKFSSKKALNDYLNRFHSLK
jgi:ParB family chromosome partitioning protein